MSFDLCYVIALPSRMHVIPAVFTLQSLFGPVFSYVIPQQPEQL